MKQLFMAGKTAKYYAANPAAKKKHNDYQKAFNKQPAQVKKRVELNQYNRLHPSKKNDDASHKGSKIVGFLNQSANRGSKVNAPGDRRARQKGATHKFGRKPR